MTGQEEPTEIELEIGSARIRVSGTEEFVKIVFTDELWIGNICHLLEKITALPIEKKVNKEQDSETDVSETSWVKRIAKDADVSEEFIEDTFQKEGDFVKVYDWPVDGNTAERRREVALLIMYPNNLLYNTDEFSKDKFTGIYDNLGLKYDHNLRSQLTKYVGIDSPEPDKYKINAQGRKAAKKLIKDEATRKAG